MMTLSMRAIFSMFATFESISAQPNSSSPLSPPPYLDLSCTIGSRSSLNNGFVNKSGSGLGSASLRFGLVFSPQAGGEEGGREVMFMYFLLVSFPSWPVRPENKQWEPASMNGETCLFLGGCFSLLLPQRFS